MWRWRLAIVLLITGCSKGPEADLPSIATARSLAAEWAMVNEQAASGHLAATYVSTMRTSVHQHLQTTLSALTEPRSPYGDEVRALIAEPADALPQKLRAHANRLKRTEDSLESA
jgi:hypothetical protein